jgi:hypothetical protein
MFLEMLMYTQKVVCDGVYMFLEMLMYTQKSGAHRFEMNSGRQIEEVTL